MKQNYDNVLPMPPKGPRPCGICEGHGEVPINKAVSGGVVICEMVTCYSCGGQGDQGDRLRKVQSMGPMDLFK